MHRIAIFIACLWAASLGAAPKAVAYLKLTKATPIYHGADLNSKVEEQGLKGQVFELVDSGLTHGFYKIDLDGHVAWVPSGAVVLLSASGTPVPTAAPTLAPSVKATKVPEAESDDDEGKGKEGDDEESKAKATPTRKPTAKPSDEDDDEPEAKATPTAVATRKPTLKPTEEEEDEHGRVTPTSVPTRKATAAPTEEPTEAPTAAPTRKPTLAPTAEPTDAPTAVPTRRPTLAPTPIPVDALTEAPTEAPTALPTRRPTLAFTPVPTATPYRSVNVPPTAVPTLRPTPIPTAAPTAIPGVITPERARGKRRQQSTVQAQPPRGGGRQGVWQSTLQVGGTIASSISLNREAGHLDSLEFYLPIGMGKHETLVQPPFKQNAGVNDQRPVEFGGFVGLGAELRLARPVRLGFDWVAHSHRTKAADLGIPAPKVGVPGSPATTLFDESEAWYRMNAHQFRLNLKLSLPHPVVEPWVSGSYGAWVWNAELSDLHREITYGEDAGVAWGGTLGTGIDFHGSFAGGLGWTITPFVEWGAPQVNPTFTNVAGLGVDWKDTFGTPVAVPARAGLQFGIGF